jgi:adenosylmethionine---8-amino-7-oxononanoate aminotransferase
MNLSQKDTQFVWHPYTHQKDRLPSIPIARGKNTLLYDTKGNTYIDAISSWWVTIHGHGNKFIAKSLYKQASRLEQVIFAGFTHKPAVSLAEKLLKILPGNFSKIFYSDNGSTSTEVALKMALQYWMNKNETKRTRVVAFNHSYHGDTFGAMSVSERGTFNFAFWDKLFEVTFIDTPDKNNLQQLKDIIDPISDEIACIIYEPLLQGAGGMRMYPAEELDRLLGYLKQQEVICIADEVLTGFYRTGKFFAGEYLSQKADIICMSKGLTGGTMAMGVTACTQEIYEAFVTDDKAKTFFHGHSFTANPIACIASLASLQLLQDKKRIKRIREIVSEQENFLYEIQSYVARNVIKNLRQLGTICAFEIVTSEKDSYLQEIGKRFTTFCLKNGVYLRPLGNTIYIMPPYCITKKELRKVHQTIMRFLQQLIRNN